MKISQYTIKIYLLAFLLLSSSSCKKFIEVDAPETSVNEGNVYRYDGTASSAIIGIYTSMATVNFSGNVSFYSELYADNLTLLNKEMDLQVPFYLNNLRPDDVSAYSPWRTMYQHIYMANAAIEGLNGSNSLTPKVKQHLLGQAHFLRAFYYFYLTNFYGPVPLALSTKYEVNNALQRSSVQEVYSQIIKDLDQAKNLLPEGYLTNDMKTELSDGQELRITPNKSAANALLARVYLYQNDWANAESASSEVISNTILYSANVAISQIFQRNSRETIWAMQPVNTGENAGEAELYTLRPGDPTPISGRSSFLSESFMNLFQTGDLRKIAWIDFIENEGFLYPYPAKYKALSYSGSTEQSILLRFGEQYLIRAEARIQQNKLAQGIEDLNVLRQRAIDPTEQDDNKKLKLLATNLNKDQALSALAYERRVELFAESAHRLFDLKRTGQIDAVMSIVTPQKGGTWSNYKSVFPIPSSEILNNRNLVQNDGYPKN